MRERGRLVLKATDTNINTGIPTYYKGEMFRSKAEARTAYMLDNLGYTWYYEPMRINLGNNVFYQPDFLIENVILPDGTVKEKLFVEVKGGGTKGIKDFDIVKFRMFHELGASLYVMQSPAEFKGFIRDAFTDSNGVMFSTKYLCEDRKTRDEPVMCLFDKHGLAAWDGLSKIPDIEIMHDACEQFKYNERGTVSIESLFR